MDETNEPTLSRTALHRGFTFIYLLLISWFFLSIFSELDERYTPIYLLTDRLSRNFYKPFHNSFVYINVQAVLYAIFSFAFIHCAIVRATPRKSDPEMLVKLINIFRLTFFFTATALALLIVIRLTVETYRDLTGTGRPQYIFARPPGTSNSNQNTSR